MGFNATSTFIQNMFTTKQLSNRYSRKHHPALSNDIQQITLNDLSKYQPLLDLQDDRQLLQAQVILHGTLRSFQSMIIGIDFEKRRLLLDTFSPNLPPRLLTKEHAITIRHSANNQLLEFTGQFLSVSDHNEPLIMIELPEELAYRQRRFYPRLTTEQHNNFGLSLQSSKHSPWFVQLKNISAGGACVNVGGDISKAIKKNGQIKNCEVKLPFGLKVPCSVTVKNYKVVKRPYAYTQINLSFHEMEFQNRLELQHQISLSQKLVKPSRIKLNDNDALGNKKSATTTSVAREMPPTELFN